MVTADGKTRMDALRARLDGFIASEIAESRRSAAAATARSNETIAVAGAGLAVSVLLVLLVAIFALRSLLGPVRRVAFTARRLADGDLSARVRTRATGELADLAESFNDMAASLQQMRDELERQNAELEAQQTELVVAVEDLAEEKAGVDRFHASACGSAAQNELKPLAEIILEEVGDIAGAQIGALYVLPAGSEDALLMVRAASPPAGCRQS